MKCQRCGSYAINHNSYGRDGSDPDLCDVCYWRKRAETGWKPIETAPKDGGRILLLFGNTVADGFWWKAYDDWSVHPGRHEIPVFQDGPTHWMPLPEAPKQEKQA